LGNSRLDVQTLPPAPGAARRLSLVGAALFPVVAAPGDVASPPAARVQ